MDDSRTTGTVAVVPDAAPAKTASVTELSISAFRSLRATTVPISPVTLLAGPSGSGKSTVLEAYEGLARLGGGETLGEVFGGARGDPSAYVPSQARGDRDGRRGFRIGCTVNGPVGPVRCEVSVQAEPELRIVGERLTGPGGELLLATALRDPRKRMVQAQWHTAGTRVTRAPLPDDRLGTALLPLRVAGTTEGQRRVLAAAEQVVVALRSVFACDPRPEAMRDPVAPGDGLLRGGCDNVAAVLRRTRSECGIRFGLLLEAVRAGVAGPVAGLGTEVAGRGADRGLIRAVLERGEGRGVTPLSWLGDGELRYAALALVLLTGPGVLAMDNVEEVLPAQQALTVLADGLDRGLDARQTTELLALADRMGQRGHVRLMASLSGEGRAIAEETVVGSAGGAAKRVDGGAGAGVSLVDLGGE